MTVISDAENTFNNYLKKLLSLRNEYEIKIDEIKKADIVNFQEVEYLNNNIDLINCILESLNKPHGVLLDYMDDVRFFKYDINDIDLLKQDLLKESKLKKSLIERQINLLEKKLSNINGDFIEDVLEKLNLQEKIKYYKNRLSTLDETISQINDLNADMFMNNFSNFITIILFGNNDFYKSVFSKVNTCDNNNELISKASNISKLAYDSKKLDIFYELLLKYIDNKKENKCKFNVKNSFLTKNFDVVDHLCDLKYDRLRLEALCYKSEINSENLNKFKELVNNLNNKLNNSSNGLNNLLAAIPEELFETREKIIEKNGKSYKIRYTFIPKIYDGLYDDYSLVRLNELEVELAFTKTNFFGKILNRNEKIKFVAKENYISYKKEQITSQINENYIKKIIIISALLGIKYDDNILHKNSLKENQKILIELKKVYDKNINELYSVIEKAQIQLDNQKDIQENNTNLILNDINALFDINFNIDIIENLSKIIIKDNSVIYFNISKCLAKIGLILEMLNSIWRRYEDKKINESDILLKKK